MSFSDDRSSRKGIAVGFIALVIYANFLINSALFESAKLKTADILQRIKLGLKTPPPQINDIVNIVIDDESIKRLNRPLDRVLFALLIEKLSEYSPKVIGLDISFVGEGVNPQDDVILQQALRKSGNVILASFFNEEGEYIIPGEKFVDAAFAYGLSHKPLDVDFLIRRSTLAVFLEEENKWDYTFALKVACKYLDIPFSNIHIDKANSKILLNYASDSGRRRSYLSIPIREDNTVLLNPSSFFDKFRTILLWRIIEEKLHVEELKGKIVFVGLGSGFKNVFSTPFGIVSGEDLNAIEALMIITENFIKEIPPWINTAAMLVFYLLTSFILFKFPPSKIFLSLFCAVIIFLATGFMLLENNYLLDFFSPIFVVILTVITASSYKYASILFENIRLRTLAITDGLTGLYIHRYFTLKLKSEFRKSFSNKADLSLVIVDIDHFKRINDNYGHESGNEILKQFTHILIKSSRRQDTVARYGGEEFAIILPHTVADEAFQYAEKIRKKVEEFKFALKDGKILHITLSAGVASYPKAEFMSAHDFIKKADAALYKAKNEGRNRTCKSW